MSGRHQAFVPLQDKYVNARAVACCPSMDLVAVLTGDRQLLVHRMVSWQKLLHVKPAEVAFEMAAMAWSPDGLLLAVGCDDGELVMFQVETGERLPERRGLRSMSDALAHGAAITAMHWTKISGGNEPGDATSRPSTLFQNRAARFLGAGGTSMTAQELDSVLVTADADGRVALWWGGKVLLASVSVASRLSDVERELAVGRSGQSPLGSEAAASTANLHIEQAHLSPDLTRLFVWVRFGGVSDGERRLIALALPSLQRVCRDASFLARTADACSSILDSVLLAAKQMPAEWKNATRIFEVKMGLLGLLYERYACDQPPQVDMLAVAATGIASPALAQYFAQDIQEMSVARMRKALAGGCDALRVLGEQSLKRGLVGLLFHLSELRGQASWRRNDYADELGVAVEALDSLISDIQELLIEVEEFTRALQETRQDFSLLLHWISERIRIHTNTATTSGGNGASATSSSGAEYCRDASNSLLNQRRLCDFFRRAAQSAHEFQQRQPSHSKFKIETTFGNPISQRFLCPGAALATANAAIEPGTPGRLLGLIARVEAAWVTLAKRIVTSVAGGIVRDDSGCFAVKGHVEEFHLQFLEGDNAALRQVDELDCDDNEHHAGNDDDDDGIDWEAFKMFEKPDPSRSPLVLAGFRASSNELVMLRGSSSIGSSTEWEAAIISLSAYGSAWTEASRSTVNVKSFGFYSNPRSGANATQIALLLTQDRVTSQGLKVPATDDSTLLALAPLKRIAFQSMSPSCFSTLLNSDSSTNRPVRTVQIVALRSRGLGDLSHAPASPQSASSADQIIAHGPRGVVCVAHHYPQHRLAIFDVEEDEDDGSEAEASEAEETEVVDDRHADDDRVRSPDSMEIDR